MNNVIAEGYPVSQMLSQVPISVYHLTFHPTMPTLCTNMLLLAVVWYSSWCRRHFWWTESKNMQEICWSRQGYTSSSSYSSSIVVKSDCHCFYSFIHLYFIFAKSDGGWNYEGQSLNFNINLYIDFLVIVKVELVSYLEKFVQVVVNSIICFDSLNGSSVL